jgi:hypothetical protein
VWSAAAPEERNVPTATCVGLGRLPIVMNHRIVVHSCLPMWLQQLFKVNYYNLAARESTETLIIQQPVQYGRKYSQVFTQNLSLIRPLQVWMSSEISMFPPQNLDQDISSVFHFSWCWENCEFAKRTENSDCG